MKRILITGLNSYIGNSFEEYLKQVDSDKTEYEITKISLRKGLTEDVDLRGYDSILHVAGIAHADVTAVSEEVKAGYYAVNCDLAYETAQKAKGQGVKQFIYMSSVIVYGESARVGGKKHITKETTPSPANFYGDSKWQAEQKLNQLADEGFHVAIVRAPMVYGRDSKGNFPMLRKFANKLCVFPKVKNARSMIYIENLAEFLKRLMDSEKGGLFLPQNKEYSNTAEMVKMLRKTYGKSMYLSFLLGWMVYVGAIFPGKIGKLINKAFGSMTVDQTFSNEEITGYQVYSLEESIRRIGIE